MGMRAYDVACVLAFFSFTFKGTYFPCAVIRWFDKVGDGPDENTGMWVVRPACLPSHAPKLAVIHIDTIYRVAHLIPVYGSRSIPRDIQPHESYDTFRSFYVNKFADHHAFEITS